MNILFITYTEITSPGGISNTILELAGNLSKMGHSVTVLQPNPCDLPAEELFSGFKIIRVKSRSEKWLYGFNMELLLYLVRHVRYIDPAIVHVHGYHSLLSLETICFLRSKKYDTVFSPHYMPAGHNTYAGKYLWKLYNLAGKKCLKNIDKVLCASQYECDSVINDLGVPKSKITIIYHGVDHIQDKPARKKENCTRLLFVGSLIELKGVQYILKAVHEMKFTFHRNVMLNIVGSGGYKNKLLRLSSELNIADCVIWYSNLSHDELDWQYLDADVFLLLSGSENYGIVVVESLSVGTPAIVSNNTAIKEFTTINGCFGADYPPDPKKVAELIIRIVDNGAIVDQHSGHLHTWEEISKLYENIFSEIITDR